MASREDEEFMKLGVQYYVAARYTALTSVALMPVCGNLCHHALEMFLKAGLSRNLTLKELRNKFGHNLVNIWNAFKKDFPDPLLPHFDKTIADIEEFEDIRYPDNLLKHGAQIVVGIRGSVPAKISPIPSRREPLYKFYVDDVDRLIGEIFRVSSRNPLFFTMCLSAEFREILARDNPVAAQIVGTRDP